MRGQSELAAFKTLAFGHGTLSPRSPRRRRRDTSKVTTLALALQQRKRDVQKKPLELPREQAVLVLVVDKHRQALAKQLQARELSSRHFRD